VQECLYSLETEVPLIAFIEDRCLTLFDHPLVDSMHTDSMPSIEHLVAAAGIQVWSSVVSIVKLLCLTFVLSFIFIQIHFKSYAL
jgi:hypothetical protein